MRLALAALLLAAGCGQGDDQGDEWPSDRAAAGAPGAEPAPADAAIRRAAAALSVANAQVAVAQGAWGRALQCAAAVDASAQVLRTSPLVGEAEYRQIISAGQAFADQALALAAAEEQTAQATRERLAALRREAGEAPQQALRTALGCLRAQADGAAG